MKADYYSYFYEASDHRKTNQTEYVPQWFMLREMVLVQEAISNLQISIQFMIHILSFMLIEGRIFPLTLAQDS